MGEAIEAQSSVTTVSAGRVAWSVAIAVFVLGDVVTTAYGLQVGVAESNPLPAMVMNVVGPLPAMIGLKLLAVGILWGLYRAIDDRYRPEMIPCTLSAIGTIAVVANVTTITLATL